jgi:glutamine synthetase
VVTRTFCCEYIWADGTEPTQSLRSKTMVLSLTKDGENEAIRLDDFPVWNFDGSSTNQGTTEDSDRVLRPVFACSNPLRPSSILVLCDVLNTDLTPHSSNYRSKLMDVYAGSVSSEPVAGFEQEYFIRDENGIAGWPKSGMPSSQGQYYCAVGSGNVAQRDLAESHLDACMAAGLSITGINAEVALGQWEYQVGGPTVSAITAADHLWISRYILRKLGERNGLSIDLDPKPIMGDWNGSGLHVNYSTKEMRSEGGIKVINSAINSLSEDTSISLAKNNYGDGLERRLTGKHETSDINTFTSGVSDRSASVRIPWQVSMSGRGYFEDRRPNSNADPYRVLFVLMSSIVTDNIAESENINES